MGKNYNVLIVEDDTSIRQILTLVLEDAGFTVEAAKNGKEALHHLRTQPPPLVVLLDLMMPIMDGWEFLAIRRDDERLARIPTVVMSASIIDSGALNDTPILRKPFDTALLIETLNAHI